MSTALRNWAIIGVVGRTFRADDVLDESEEEALQLAEEVGAYIADRGLAVLTGGHHKVPERSVKYQALVGAMQRAGERTVRLIGIVPEQISKKLNPSIEDRRIESERHEQEGLRYRYLHTQLQSKLRDPITGAAADVLIALEGRKGTPREVAAALEAARPVVFLRSLEILRQPVVHILTRNTHARMFPAEPCQARTAEEAVDRALSLIDWGNASQRLNGDIGDAKIERGYEDVLAELRRDYEQALVGF